MSCGIYCIKNTANNKVYIGQSVSIEERWRTHKRALSKKEHENKHLENSWHKHGSNSFSFTVLELCTTDELFEKEQYWILYYDSMNSEKGYNKREAGNKGKVSEDTKIKMSNAQKGKTASAETRKKQSEAHKNISEETRNKMSISKRNMSDETKRKIGESGKGRVPPNKGVSPSDETKKKISDGLKASVTPERRKQISESKSGIVHDEEYKKRMSISLKESWIRRNLLSSNDSKKEE